MRKTNLFCLRGVSTMLSTNLRKVLDIHTLFLLQVCNTVPHPELLRLVAQVLVCCCFHLALLLVFSKPDVLQPLIDVEAEVPLVVVVLGPPRDKLLLCLFRLSRDFYQALRQKLDYIVLERLLAGMTRADRDEAFHKRFQFTYTRTPDVSRLAFYLVDGVVGA